MNSRQKFVPNGGDGRQDLVPMSAAADRAGAMVTEQVRSIIDAAEKSAAEIRRTAERDAELMRQEASEAAARILDRLDAIEGPLGDLVANLRHEADSLSADVSRR